MAKSPGLGRLEPFITSWIFTLRQCVVELLGCTDTRSTCLPPSSWGS